jgi:penicillin G amidase
VTLSCNWVVADRRGDIGYQQSGRLPRRSHSGLHPVPGWDESCRWRGIVEPEELFRTVNPPEGFLATANNEINPPGGPLVCNLPMGPYRVGRISDLLHGRDGLTVEDMKKIQLDLVSAHAERLMGLIRPHLPVSPAGELLRGWDLRYDVDSKGATLFEDVYCALLRRVFGQGLLGEEAWDALGRRTGLLDVYYNFFDDALMEGGAEWYGEEGRDQVVAGVVEEVLDGVDPAAVERWGEVRSVVMTNVFFAGKLPRFLGFDYGPIELPGGRGTVVQGGVFKAHGRLTTFFPSARFITDLGRDEAETVLAGGPSARRLSGYYRTDIERWLTGRYKTLKA